MLSSLVFLAVAGSAEVEPTLARAEQQLKQLDYRAAAETFEPICQLHACSRAQHLRWAYGLATALASQGQSNKASLAFRTLLFVDPDWKLPSGSSPRLREPFEQAEAFMRLRPRGEVTVRGELSRGTTGSATGVLSCDPLELVGALVLVLSGPSGELELEAPTKARTPTADGGFTETFSPTEAQLSDATEFRVRARSRSGGVLFESEARPILQREARPALSSRSLLTLDVLALLDAFNLQLGAEVRVGVAALPVLEASVGALLGQRTGLRAQLTVHFPRSSRLTPTLAARFGLHPLESGVAVGGGLALGLTLELGPGRIVGVVVGEAFAAPAPYSPWVIGPMVGYQLDVPGLTVR